MKENSPAPFIIAKLPSPGISTGRSGRGELVRKRLAGSEEPSALLTDRSPGGPNRRSRSKRAVGWRCSGARDGPRADLVRAERSRGRSAFVGRAGGRAVGPGRSRRTSVAPGLLQFEVASLRRDGDPIDEEPGRPECTKAQRRVEEDERDPGRGPDERTGFVEGVLEEESDAGELLERAQTELVLDRPALTEEGKVEGDLSESHPAGDARRPDKPPIVRSVLGQDLSAPRERRARTGGDRQTARGMGSNPTAPRRLRRSRRLMHLRGSVSGRSLDLAHRGSCSSRHLGK